MGKSEFTTVTCPACGAPVVMGETSGTCAYCETLVERAGKVQGQAGPVRRFVVVGTRSQTQPRQASGRGCGVILSLTIALFVGFVLVVSGVLPMQRIASELNIKNNGWPLFDPGRIADLIQVVPRDADADDLLVSLYQGDKLTLGLVDSTGQTLRWQTAPLSTNGHQAVVALGPDALYLVDHTHLQALRLADGTPIWQTQLAVELPPGCDDCLMVQNDRVIALQKDRTLQAFDTRTGKPAWNMRLEEMPLHIPRFGGMLVLIQRPEEQTDAQIQLVDPASGTIAQRISPACESEGSDYHSATFSSVWLLLPSSDGTALLTIFGAPDACAQRWEFGATAATWQVWLESETSSALRGTPQTLLTEQHVFIGNDGILLSLDTSNGEIITLVRDEEHHLIPLFGRDNILVVKATPSWDSSRHRLWGVDVATGERRWEYSVQAREWFGDSGFNEWGAQLTPDGITVVQVPGDTREIIVERLDLQTGASVERQVTNVPGDGTTVVWTNRWTDRMAWLVVDTALYTIDLRSGATTTKQR